MILTLNQLKTFKSGVDLFKQKNSKYAINELVNIIGTNEQMEEHGILAPIVYDKELINFEIQRIESEIIDDEVLKIELENIKKQLNKNYVDYKYIMKEVIRLELSFNIPIFLEHKVLFDQVFSEIFMEVVNKHYRDRYSCSVEKVKTKKIEKINKKYKPEF